MIVWQKKYQRCIILILSCISLPIITSEMIWTLPSQCWLCWCPLLLLHLTFLVKGHALRLMEEEVERYYYSHCFYYAWGTGMSGCYNENTLMWQWATMMSYRTCTVAVVCLVLLLLLLLLLVLVVLSSSSFSYVWQQCWPRLVLLWLFVVVNLLLLLPISLGFFWATTTLLLVFLFLFLFFFLCQIPYSTSILISSISIRWYIYTVRYCLFFVVDLSITNDDDDENWEEEEEHGC